MMGPRTPIGVRASSVRRKWLPAYKRWRSGLPSGPEASQPQTRRLQRLVLSTNGARAVDVGWVAKFDAEGLGGLGYASQLGRGPKATGLAVIEQFELSHPAPKALRRGLEFLGLRRALEEMQDFIPFVDPEPRFLCARERYCFLTIADHRPVDEAQLWAEYNIEHHLQSNPRGSNKVPGALSFFLICC